MLGLFLSVIIIFQHGYFARCNVESSSHRELINEATYNAAIVEKYNRLDHGLHVALKKIQSYLGKREENGRSYVVEKTKYENKTRVVFFAGLEGTGHHAIQEALKACPVCNPSGVLSEDLFNRLNNEASHGLFGGADVPIHYKHLEIVYNHFVGIQLSTAGLKVEKGTLHIIGLEMGVKSGMISYPNYDDIITKPIDHPDLIPLAAAAEAANIDLRIVILIRNAYDTLYSALSRNFGENYETAILIDNASLLNNQISMLDPRYFICIEYEKWKEYSASQLKAMGEFLHPRLDEKTMIAMVSKIDFRTHIQNNQTTNNTNTLLPQQQSRTTYLRRRTSTATIPVIDDYSVARLGLEMEKMKSSCPKIF
jgi:hypothetical protein